MADLNSYLNERTSLRKQAADDAERELKADKERVQLESQNTGKPGNSQVANYTSTSGPTANGPAANAGAFGGTQVSSGNPNNPFSILAASSAPRFSDGTDKLIQILRSGVGTMFKGAAAAASFLPTSQEALNTQQLASRINFYSGSQEGLMGDRSYTGTLNGPFSTSISRTFHYQGVNRMGAYGIQQQAAAMGTSISPMDAVAASNEGIRQGILPGLKNYRAGENYSGALGSAALASNLVPGTGITGGMGVVGALNQAASVNMLRMFGIQARTPDGAGIQDLNSIITQVYDKLAAAGSVTPETIAVSAMPGNALASILNQYFGADENLKSTILSGIMQKARVATDKNLKKFASNPFSKPALTASGASTSGVQSAADRSTRELNLIQTYSDTTIKGLVGSNNLLGNIYKDLVRMKGNSLVTGGQTFMTGLENFAGARGGGGQLVIDMLLNGAANGLGAITGKSQLLGGLVGAGAAGAGLYTLDQLGSSSSATGSPLSSVFNPVGGTRASSGPVYTGAITVNVSLPPELDPYGIGSAISTALARST